MLNCRNPTDFAPTLLIFSRPYGICPDPTNFAPTLQILPRPCWSGYSLSPDPTDFIGRFDTELKRWYKTEIPLSGDCKSADHWTILMRLMEMEKMNITTGYQCFHEMTNIFLAMFAETHYFSLGASRLMCVCKQLWYPLTHRYNMYSLTMTYRYGTILLLGP